MDTLKDIWASLVAGVQERTTNPLTFSFIASWCLWNFKFLLVLAGDGTTAERLQAIDSLYPFTLSTYLGHALLAPLLSACAYVFWYPSISQRVIDFYRRKQVAISNSVREIEGARLMTVDESHRLVRDLEAERNEWQTRETRLTEQLRQVRAALEAAEKQVKEFESSKTAQPVDKVHGEASQVTKADSIFGLRNTKATAETGLELFRSRLPNIPRVLPEVHQRLIKALSEYATAIPSGDLASRLQLNHSVALVALEDLQTWEIINATKGGLWELTPDGHRLAVAMVSTDEEHPY